MNMIFKRKLPIPKEIKEMYPISPEGAEAKRRNDESIRSYVERIVPTYHPTYNGQPVLPQPTLEKAETEEQTVPAH